MPNADYVIRLAENDEKPILVSFLEEHFFPNEYLLTSYFAKNKEKITEEEELIIKEDLRKQHEIMLANLPCLVAVHRETEIIVGINVIMVEERFNGTTLAVNDIPFRSKLLSEWFSSVLDEVDEKINFFEIFPTLNSALKLIILCVNKNHGGKGLAYDLLIEAVNWSKCRRIDLVHGVFTSPFSRRAAEKVGLQSYLDIDILSFRDSEGNLIYNDMESYIISIMAMKLR